MINRVSSEHAPKGKVIEESEQKFCHCHTYLCICSGNQNNMETLYYVEFTLGLKATVI